MIDCWNKEDPRYSINKRADIIILRPSSNGRLEAGTAHVDTKETWCIFTSFTNCSLIDADSDWDKDWLWTWAPAK